MYSGQGSQYFQMGKELFVNNDIFRHWMMELDGLAHDLIGESVLDVMYNPASKIGDIFNRTLYTHVTIFMVECALTQVLLNRGIKPSAVIGASVGEFAAAVTAGIWDAGTGLQAVVKQAKLLESCCAEGGMLAVLHDIGIYSEAPELFEHCDIVSVNNRTHFIVSGKAENILKADRYLKNKKITSFQLPVSHGFHSSEIDPAADAYVSYLQRQTLYNKPKIPYISSLYAQRIDSLDQDYFWKVVREPIRFTDAVHSFNQFENDCVYIDLGPSGTLVNIIKMIKQNSKLTLLPTITPFNRDVQNLNKVIDAAYARF